MECAIGQLLSLTPPPAIASLTPSSSPLPSPPWTPLFSFKSSSFPSSYRLRTPSFASASRRRQLPRFAVFAESQSTNDGTTTAAPVGQFKRVLLPIIDQNPYLSEATRQAAATTTALAKKYGADITVVVIDKDTKESIEDHDLRISNIRWHLAEGGYQEFGLMERLGEGKRPAAVIGEVADDMGLDLVVLSMETIHSKQIDGNLLAEFVPCPVLLLPL